jgi:HemY protein
MIAIGAGDRTLALRYAGQARKALPNEPLTHLLRAQAAELTGDRATSRRIFEAMLSSPDTEQLGLRGLFLEARREGEKEAARQFAERALKLNPKLDWPVEALFDLQCRAGDWQGALDTLGIARRQNLVDKAVANRRRAVLLTAQAQAAEDTSPEKALELALEAHRLAPDLVPAAAIGGRILASRGNTPRAARVLLRTWRLSPHPDLAAAYAYARPGDSPRDRLNRMRHLARLTPNDAEGPIAFAITAIEAREWDEARKVLEPLLEGRLTQRVAALMARIEGEQHGHAGRVREWLARAVNAPRDPAWTADGIVSDRWAPVSPVTGALDAFRWRVPVEETGGAVLTARAEAMAALGAGTEPLIAQPQAIKPAAAFPATETVEPAAPPPPVPAAPAVPPVTVEAEPVPPPPAPAAKPAAAPPPAEAKPIAARVAASGAGDIARDVAGDIPEEELRERIWLAAQRAVAASDLEQTAPSSPPEKPAAPKPVAAKPPPPPPAAPARKAEMPQQLARRTPEPKIYVAPRAPDDPGPELAEESDLEIGPLRPTGAKA